MSRKRKLRGRVDQVGPLFQEPDRTNDAILEWRRSFVQRMATDLKSHEVEVPPAWRACTEPGKLYLCECFDRGYQFISKLVLALKFDDPTKSALWFVEGEFMAGQRHGWVELPGGIVFDGNFQQFYAQKGYYDTVHARPWYKYSDWAAFIVAVNMPLNPDGLIPLGNWHSYLKLPWADPNNPTLIDDDLAEELVFSSGLIARRDLCRLGSKQPGVWMSAADWAKSIARRRLTSTIVPEADRQTAADRTRSIEQLLDAHLQETLVGDTKTEFVTMQLEKSSPADPVPRYRFVVLRRKERTETA